MSWVLLDPQSDPFPRSLSLHLRDIYIYMCACGRSPLAMYVFTYVCTRGVAHTRNGKLNQRISRIYRRAIPGYCKCTVSVTSCRIFLRNSACARGCLSAISPFLTLAYPLTKTRFVRKSSPPGITDLSTSFLRCLVTLPLFVIVPYLGQL